MEDVLLFSLSLDFLSGNMISPRSVAVKQSWISMFTKPVDFLHQFCCYQGGRGQAVGRWCRWPVLLCTAPLLSKSLLRSTTQFWRSVGRPGRFSVDSCAVERETTLCRPAELRFKFSSTKQDRQQQVEWTATADKIFRRLH